MALTETALPGLTHFSFLGPSFSICKMDLRFFFL